MAKQISSPHDEQILKLMEQVKERKKEIETIESPGWKTNCSFSYNEHPSSAVNLHTITEARTLVMIAAFLMEKKKTYEAAAYALGVPDIGEFTWQNYTVTAWIEDVSKRLKKLQLSEKRTQLEQLEKRLDAIISPELRAQMELEAIAQALQ